MTEKASIEALAAALRHTAYNAYRATLIGNAPGVITRLSERMAALKIGDIVIEISTIYMAPTRPDLDGIGYLLRVEQEPVDFGPGAEPWDEEAEGQPHPTERVTYIRTFDGREFRWTNASFVSVLAEIMRD